MLREEKLCSRRMAENANYRNPNLHHMLDRFMRDHMETSFGIVRKIVRRYSDPGRAAIRGSGVRDEHELLEALDAIRDGAADFEYDLAGWLSDNS